MDTLKTLVSLGQNVEYDSKHPVKTIVEKRKEYEVREYSSGQYFFIRTVTKVDASAAATEKTNKKAEDPVTTQVWKLMKYTQGHNEQKQIMKFYLPVYVKVVEYDTKNEANGEMEHLQEVKIMACFAPEFQAIDGNPFPAPPKPNDQEVEHEVMDGFRCYVKTFSGFAKDEDYKRESKKLIELLRSENIQIKDDTVICVSYDPPHKLFNRRNEVLILATV